MIPHNFRPLLAISSDDVTVQPKVQYVSEKLDGVRILFFGGVAYSRSLKPLPNKLLQKLAQDNAEVLEGCDSEIIAGDSYAKNVLQRSVSFAMKEDKVDEFTVFLFDKYNQHKPNQTWCERFHELKQLKLPENVEVLEHYYVTQGHLYTPEQLHILPWVDLDLFEQHVLAKGGEGCILRDGEGLYKFGRSGKVKPSIQKLKRFQDDEFRVVGYEQLESNQNEAKTNELGRTARSTSKEGKVPVEALGALVLALPDGRTFNAGSGFTEKQRKELWQERDTLQGRLAKIKFFGYSPDGVPLLPTFLDFRSELDL